MTSFIVEKNWVKFIVFFIDLDKDQNISAVINSMLDNEDKLKLYKANCAEAAKELNWDVEFGKVKELLLDF